MAQTASSVESWKISEARLRQIAVNRVHCKEIQAHSQIMHFASWPQNVGNPKRQRGNEMKNPRSRFGLRMNPAAKPCRAKTMPVLHLVEQLRRWRAVFRGFARQT